LKTLQAVRGMNDVLPEDSALWQYFERTVADLLTTYGYQQVRMPIVEPTELFKRSIGEVTDIVEKEMYTFEDRNGDSLTLRPEGTAGCVRAMLQQAGGLLVAGSSLMVYSGLRFVHEAVAQGKPVAAINQGRMRSEDLLALKIEQDCGPLLQQLAQDLEQ